MWQPGTVANTGASAGTITLTFTEGSDTGFTNSTNSNQLDVRTVIIGATATATPEALNIIVPMTQRYLKATLAIPAAPAGMSCSGMNVALQAGGYQQ
jgi:hypothetical protein